MSDVAAASEADRILSLHRGHHPRLSADERAHRREHVLAMPEAHGRRRLAVHLAENTRESLESCRAALAKAPQDEAEIEAEKVVALHAPLAGHRRNHR